VVSSDMILGIALGVGVPMLGWAFRIFWLVNATHKMHLKPDEHGFGSATTEALLINHFKVEEGLQRDAVSATKALRFAIKELSHYTRWSVKQRTGKEPPPYVRDAGEDI